MLDWNNYRSELMQRLGELGKLTPETMKGVVALGNAGNKTDLLGVLGIFRPKTTKCSGGPAVCGLQRGITFFEIPIWALFE